HQPRPQVFSSIIKIRNWREAMQHVQSVDGTQIAYDSVGTGPALVVVVGAFNDRSSSNALASRLSSSFTVYQYDRRGRGDSREAGPYSVDREVEDLAALIKAAGGSAFLFGHSSGGALPSRPRPPASRFVASSSMSRLTPRDPP